MLFFFRIFPSRQGYLTCDIEEKHLIPPERERSINPSTDEKVAHRFGLGKNQGLQSVNLCVTHSMDDVPGGICGQTWKVKEFWKNEKSGYSYGYYCFCLRICHTCLTNAGMICYTISVFLHLITFFRSGGYF